MFDFERVWLVARREWLTRLRQRSFQVTTIVQLVIFIAAACIPTIASVLSDGDDSDEVVTVAVLDEAGGNVIDLLAPILAAEIPDQPRINLRSFDGSRDDLQARVDDGDFEAGLAVSRDNVGALQ